MPDVLRREIPQTPEPSQYMGQIIIEWPAPPRHPAMTTIRDASTGEPIRNVAGATIHLRWDGILWADLTLSAIEDGAVIWGTFPFLVKEMRVSDG